MRLQSWLIVLVIVAVDGYTAVVGDGSRHGRNSCDDTRCRVVAQDRVRGFTVFPPATENEDLSVAH